MLINAGVNMPAPLGARASRPPGEADAPISIPIPIPISMTSRPLMVGAALAAAQVLQPGSTCRPPGSAGVPPAGGGRRTDFDPDPDPDFPISMTSRPLMVGAALAAAQVLQPVSSVCQAEP